MLQGFSKHDDQQLFPPNFILTRCLPSRFNAQLTGCIFLGSKNILCIFGWCLGLVILIAILSTRFDFYKASTRALPFLDQLIYSLILTRGFWPQSTNSVTIVHFSARIANPVTKMHFLTCIANSLKLKPCDTNELNINIHKIHPRKWSRDPRQIQPLLSCDSPFEWSCLYITLAKSFSKLSKNMSFWHDLA